MHITFSKLLLNSSDLALYSVCISVTTDVHVIGYTRKSSKAFNKVTSYSLATMEFL